MENNDGNEGFFFHLLDVIVSPIFVKGIVTLLASVVLIYLVLREIAGIELLVALITGGGIVSVSAASAGGLPKRNGRNNGQQHLPRPPKPAERTSFSYHPDDVIRMGDEYFLKKYPPAEWARTALGDGGVLFVKKDKDEGGEALGDKYG